MPETWLDQVFKADQVRKAGGVVRRQISDIEDPVNNSSKAEFLKRAKNEGAGIVFETTTQMVAIFERSKFLIHFVEADS